MEHVLRPRYISDTTIALSAHSAVAITPFDTYKFILVISLAAFSYSANDCISVATPCCNEKANQTCSVDDRKCSECCHGTTSHCRSNQLMCRCCATDVTCCAGDVKDCYLDDPGLPNCDEDCCTGYMCTKRFGVPTCSCLEDN